MASFKDLDHSDISVLKGLLGFGSTSEVLSCGFVSGNLEKFHGHYMRFDDAWERLDECHQQAICDVWEVCNIGNHDSSIGRCTIPTIHTFLGEFKKWVTKWYMAEAEQNWFDANPTYREDYLPNDVIKQHEINVSELLAAHL